MRTLGGLLLGVMFCMGLASIDVNATNKNVKGVEPYSKLAFEAGKISCPSFAEQVEKKGKPEAQGQRAFLKQKFSETESAAKKNQEENKEEDAAENIKFEDQKGAWQEKVAAKGSKLLKSHGSA